jgi:Pregnancy-associated plasma protein-A/Secretion system C-terminal sorting domain/Fibronectin type III domain
MRQQNKTKNPMNLSSISMILFLFIAPQTFVNAQMTAMRSCASAEILKKQVTNNPHFADRLEQMERTTARLAQSALLETRGTIVIPVVVHVLHATNVQNISDAQIVSQIAVLNRDFRKMNPDIYRVPALFSGVSADCGIQFKLATRDPQGNSTNGIRRYLTKKTAWNTNDDMKKPENGGAAPWDAAQYLNFWVCNMGDGTLGYAQFPGGAPETDGVVIDYRCFGTIGTVNAPYNMGRTATHEVGHYFNLQHIWGDSDCGDDHVADTPQQFKANSGMPVFPHYSNCNNIRTVDMSMNFMDYVFDDAMHLFTQGQKARMHAVLSVDGLRASLITSDGCKAPAGTVCAAPTGLTAYDMTTQTAILNWIDWNANDNYLLEYRSNGNLQNIISIQTNNTTKILTGLTPNTTYSYRVKTICGSNWSESQQFTTAAVENIRCTDGWAENKQRETAASLIVGKTIHSMLISANDKDWFKVTTTAEKPNIKVLLNQLQTDYDLKLYDSDGHLLRTSSAKGRKDECLWYNANVGATYYIQVFGYDGAFNTESCYSMTANIGSVAFQKADGTMESNVMMEDKSFEIYPNPVVGEAILEVNIEKEVLAEVKVWDLKGELRFERMHNLVKGDTKIRLDVSNLPSGFYLVSMMLDGRIQNRKMTVQTY